MYENNPNAYDILSAKLNEFVSQFYLQQWIRGILQLVLVFLSIYLITSTLEYNLYFSSSTRTFLFFFILIGAFALAIYWVIIPLMKYVDNRKRLNQKDASKIIGRHFPEVQDKLLNVIYLQEMTHSDASLELIEASIQQKSKSLILVRFNDAIDWARSKKLAMYLGIAAVLFFALWMIVPGLIRESTYRLWHYNETFAPKAPFQFLILNPNLRVQQFESIVIKAKLSGKSLPSELNILYNGISYPMNVSSNNEFTIHLKNIEASGSFKLESMGFLSDEYRIDVIPKPLVSEFQIHIDPPAYTGIPATTQKNVGDIQAPEGSTAIWKFETKYVDEIKLKIGDKIYPAEKYSNGFGLKLQLKKLNSYTVYISNHQSPIIDSQTYAVSLSPDAFPIISIQEFKDSIQDIQYYAGDVSDDYGISALYLVIQYGGALSKHAVQIPKGKNSSFHLSTQEIFKKYPKGADIHYYFEVYDNDQINGSKSTKSSSFHLKKLTEKELEKVVDNNTSQIQSELSQSLKDAKQVQKDIEAIKKKLLEKSQLDFNDKKQIEDLIKKQEELQKKLEDSKNEIQRNFDKKNELTKQEQSILDQQKQMEEMIEQMKNPELQNLLQKINELLEKGEKKDLMPNMEQLDSKSEKVEKNIDRLMQLYKNLDYKQKLNDMIDKLDELSKEQKKLALESELEKNTLEKQKELSKELDEAKKKVEELSKLNKEINKSDKKEFDEIKKDMDEAQEAQQDAEEELEQKDQKGGSQKQDKASQKMDQAKKKLNDLKKKQKKDQAKEDARMMRRLLENVMYLSFEQEKILEKTKITNTQAPSYIKLIQDEQKLKEDFKIVEDTLYKIASRQVKVRKYIFEEVDKVLNNTQLAIQRLVERRPAAAISNEQFAMAAYNKLGLMVSESLKNIEEDEDENEDENSDPQMCNNPKKGKKKKAGMSMQKLAQMQQQLNEQMEQLQKKMQEKAKQMGKEGKDGEGKEKKPNDGKPGEGGQNGNQSNQNPQNNKEAAEFARIAAQQQAIRNALKQIEESANSPDKAGKKPLGNGLQDAIDKMNETEKELVNKKFYEESLRRQKEIQIKLLESAKAEREQDEEQKRESEKAKNTKPEIPSELKRYLENKKQNESQIQRTPVGLTPYFKTLSEKYFKLIK